MIKRMSPELLALGCVSLVALALLVLVILLIRSLPRWK